MATKKAAKQVQVLCRYAHKTNGKLNGIVTYCVRSSNGKDFYYTTLINGKASGCGCPAYKPCYHMTQLEALEAARKPATSKVAKPVEQSTIQEVASSLDIPVTEVKKIAAIAAEHNREKLEGKHTEMCLPIGPRDTKKDITRAALTTNRGFQLLK